MLKSTFSVARYFSLEQRRTICHEIILLSDFLTEIRGFIIAGPWSLNDSKWEKPQIEEGDFDKKDMVTQLIPNYKVQQKGSDEWDKFKSKL